MNAPNAGRVIPPLLLLLAIPAWARNEATCDLVCVEKGELPIILSAPHGGTLDIPGVTPRKGEGLKKGGAGFFAGRDGGVEELAHATSDAIFAKCGKRPYLVAARFHRKYLDVNRPAEIGSEDPKAKAVYDAYHDALRRFCSEVRGKFGGGLLIDIHGQGTSRTTVYRGTKDGATVSVLREKHGAEYVDGPRSLLGLLKARGWKVYPDDGGKEKSGFTGGTIVRSTGTKETGIDAIQLEFGADYRSKAGREKTAKVLADALLEFTRVYSQPTAEHTLNPVPRVLQWRMPTSMWVGGQAVEPWRMVKTAPRWETSRPQRPVVPARSRRTMPMASTSA